MCDRLGGARRVERGLGCGLNRIRIWLRSTIALGVLSLCRVLGVAAGLAVAAVLARRNLRLKLHGQGAGLRDLRVRDLARVLVDCRCKGCGLVRQRCLRVFRGVALGIVAFVSLLLVRCGVKLASVRLCGVAGLCRARHCGDLCGCKRACCGALCRCRIGGLRRRIHLRRGNRIGGHGGGIGLHGCRANVLGRIFLSGVFCVRGFVGCLGIQYPVEDRRGIMCCVLCGIRRIHRIGAIGLLALLRRRRLSVRGSEFRVQHRQMRRHGSHVEQIGGRFVGGILGFLELAAMRVDGLLDIGLGILAGLVVRLIGVAGFRKQSREQFVAGRSIVRGTLRMMRMGVRLRCCSVSGHDCHERVPH